MSRDDPRSRRSVLRVGGSAAVAALLAGCGGGGSGGDGGNGGNQSDGGESANQSEGGNVTNESEGGNMTNESADGNTTNESEGGNETNESAGGGGSGALEPGEIGLGGETQAWQGVAPDPIANEENPTLTLQEGETYEITWENLDGVGHNIQILNDSDEVVDDYETEIMSEEGETQTLTIDEVTSEMTQYVCEPHQATMNGAIEVQ